MVSIAEAAENDGTPFAYENFPAGEPNGDPPPSGLEMIIDTGEWNDSQGPNRLLVTKRLITNDIFSDGFEDPSAR